MVKPTTENFHEMVVEVEWEAGSGTFAKFCGLTSNNVSRQSNMSTSEVPADCDDESKPSNLERAVQSQEQTVSGTGVWAAQSNGKALLWWRSGTTKLVRIGHMNAVVGDPEYETGPAYLTQLNNSREKGQKVTAEIQIEFDGLPDITVKEAGP